MTDKKITELNAAIVVNPADELVVTQGGETKKVTQAVLEASISVGVTGEPNTASNAGAGEGELVKAKVAFDLPFKTIKAGSNISITNNADEILIDALAVAFVGGLSDTPANYTGSSGKTVKVKAGEDGLEFLDEIGEANTISNVGTGEGTIAKAKSLLDVPLKSLKAGIGITIANNADEILITGSADSDFIGQTDTPSSYSGEAGKVCQVNVGETGLEFVVPAGGGDVTDVIGGAGLSDDDNTGAITLDVNVDGVTIEISGDALRVKDGGTTYTMPTALPDGIGDVDKLLKASGGAAILPNLNAGIPSTPFSFDFTVNSLSVELVSDKEITEVGFVDFLSGSYAGNYWPLYWANGIGGEDGYYIWYNTGADPDPSPGGFTGGGIEINIGGGSPLADVIAEATRIEIEGFLGEPITKPDLTTLRIVNFNSGPVTDSTDVLFIGLTFNVTNQGVTSVEEITDFSFLDEASETYSGATVEFKTGQGVNDWYFWFNLDTGDVDPGLTGVGIEVAVTTSDSANTIAVAAYNEYQTNVNGAGEGSAGGAPPGGSLFSTTNTYKGQVADPVETGLGSAMTSVVQQGVGGNTPGSKIEVLDSSGFGFGDFVMEAGNHWVTTANTTLEAIAISDALVAQFTLLDTSFLWGIANLSGNFFQITRSIHPSEIDPSLVTPEINVANFNNNWVAATPTIDNYIEGIQAIPAFSAGPYIGKMISVTGGIATIDSRRVVVLKNNGVIPDGVNVVASSANPGEVLDASAGNVNDIVVGVAIEGGPNGGVSTILLS